MEKVHSRVRGACRHGAQYLIQYLCEVLTLRTVQQGPFSGLHYRVKAEGSAYLPKIVGTYEKELWPVVQVILERAAAVDPCCVIDIGAAEGFYAVGMASRLKVQVIAFEQDRATQRTLRLLAKRNQVESLVDVRGACAVSDLAEIMQTGRATVMICDVEGAEKYILDLREAPQLANSYMLVEIHDMMEKDSGESLRMRFADTHSIECIAFRPRRVVDLPCRLRWLGRISRRVAHYLMDERRPEPMYWLWMVPRFAMGRHDEGEKCGGRFTT